MAGAGALRSDCGGYLTQNTAWTNVERALRSLRARFVDDRWNSPSAAPKVGSFDSLRRIFPPEGTTAEDVCKVPRPAVRRVIKSHVGPIHRETSRRTARPERHRTGNSRLDSSVRREASSFRRRRLYPPHSRSLRNIGAEIQIRGNPATVRACTGDGGAGALAPDSHEKQIVAAPRDLAGASHLPSPMSTAKRSSLVQAYNEMHGLIVGVGKNYCVKSKALCELCPLQSFLVTGRKPVSRNESPRSLGTEQQLRSNARTPAPAPATSHPAIMKSRSSD